ncbi:MAG: hypothetical protein H7843_16280 [Nitrospirota bacterium]
MTTKAVALALEKIAPGTLNKIWGSTAKLIGQGGLSYGAYSAQTPGADYNPQNPIVPQAIDYVIDHVKAGLKGAVLGKLFSIVGGGANAAIKKLLPSAPQWLSGTIGASILGGGIGLTQPAEDLRERLRNGLVGMPVFAAAHALNPYSYLGEGVPVEGKSEKKTLAPEAVTELQSGLDRMNALDFVQIKEDAQTHGAVDMKTPAGKAEAEAAPESYEALKGLGYSDDAIVDMDAGRAWDIIDKEIPNKPEADSATVAAVRRLTGVQFRDWKSENDIPDDMSKEDIIAQIKQQEAQDKINVETPVPQAEDKPLQEKPFKHIKPPELIGKLEELGYTAEEIDNMWLSAAQWNAAGKIPPVREKANAVEVQEDGNPLNNETGSIDMEKLLKALEDAGKDAKGLTTPADEARLQKQIEALGGKAQPKDTDFVNASDGTYDFGTIGKDTALKLDGKEAPIRLQVGTDKYGKIHIENQHWENEVKGLGFDSVEQYVEYVARNYNEIKKTANGRLLLAVKNGLPKIAIIELRPSESGDFYGVTTAFPMNVKSYAKLGDPLWKEHRPIPLTDQSSQLPDIPHSHDALKNEALREGQSESSISTIPHPDEPVNGEGTQKLTIEEQILNVRKGNTHEAPDLKGSNENPNGIPDNEIEKLRRKYIPSSRFSNTHSVVSYVAEVGTEDNKALAKALLDNPIIVERLKNIQFIPRYLKEDIALTGKSRGYYQDNRIKTNNSYDPTMLLHEVIHGLTTDYLNAHGSKDSSISQLRQKVIASFPENERNILNNVDARNFREKMRIEGLSIEKQQLYYGLINDHEFLSSAFTDKPFQDYLKGIRAEDKIKGQKTTLWDKFVDFIKKALGLKDSQRTMLDSVLEEGTRIMQQQSEMGGKGKGRYELNSSPELSDEQMREGMAKQGISDDIIKLATAADITSHEAFQGIQKVLELTGREKDMQILNMAYSGSPEAMAEAYRDYVAGSKQPKSFVRQVFDRIIDFLERLKNDLINPLKNETGAVDVEKLLGAGKAAERWKGSLEEIIEAGREIKSIFAPATMSEEAGRVAGSLRERNAIMDRKKDIAVTATMEISDFFDKQPKEFNDQFIDDLEAGKKQANPELQVIADIYRKALDDRYERVDKIGPGAEISYMKNYFPHLYQNPEQAAKIIEDYFAKGRLEGSKSFFKVRNIPTLKLARELGLKQLSVLLTM